MILAKTYNSDEPRDRRGRWAAIGAAVAATTAAGAATGRAYGTAIAREIGTHRGFQAADAAAQARAEVQPPEPGLLRARGVDLGSREHRVGRRWTERQTDRINAALEQRKRDAGSFPRTVAQDIEHLKGGTDEWKAKLADWRVEGAKLANKPPSAARTAAIEAHLKSRPKPPRISGVHRQLRHVTGQMGTLPQQLEAIDARLALDEFEHPDIAPGGRERAGLVQSRRALGERLQTIGFEQQRLLNARPVHRVTRKETVATRRTAEWKTKRTEPTTGADEARMREAAKTRADFQEVNRKLAPIIEASQELDRKLAAGEITKEQHAKGKKFYSADPLWKVRQEITSRPEFQGPVRRRKVSSVDVNARVGLKYTRKETTARVGRRKKWTDAKSAEKLVRRNLSREELKGIATEVRDRATRVATAVLAHAERKGAARVVRRSGEMLARYKRSITPAMVAEAVARATPKGKLIGAAAGAAVGLGAGAAGAYMLKRFDPEKHERDARGRFAGMKAPISSQPTPAKGDRPRVTLLIGMPGSGKSTWRAHQLAQHITRPTTIISTDYHVDDIARQHGITYSEAYKRVDTKALEREQRGVMRDAIAAGRDVIVDRLNLSRKGRAKTLKGVPAHYEKHAVVFHVPEDELRRRRAGRPGKAIPRRNLAEMAAAFQQPAEGEFHAVHHVRQQVEGLAKAFDPEKHARDARGRFAGRLAEKTVVTTRRRRPAGVKVHVNSHTIRANAKHGGTAPPLTIRRGSKLIYAHAVNLIGPSRVVYRPHKPLSCGAKVWIEAQDAHPVALEDLDKLAKAAPRKPRVTKAQAIADAEAEVAQRLAETFGTVKDQTEQAILNPDGGNLHDAMVDGFTHALKPLDEAARAGAAEPMPITSGGGKPATIAFSMATRSPFVSDYLDQYRQDRIAELADEQRNAVKDILLQAARAGASPQVMARQVKETIGLTRFQAQHVLNYRAELEALHPGALDRQLRDRRFDKPIQRAVDGGKPLSADQIDRYVDAYHRRYLAYRATNVARTEGVGAANNGQLAAARAYLDAHPDYTAIKTWISTVDERTRHDHAELNGQEVEGLDEPFVCDSGDEIRWPHDPAAPARQVINCRCSFGVRLVKIQTPATVVNPE